MQLCACLRRSMMGTTDLQWVLSNYYAMSKVTVVTSVHMTYMLTSYDVTPKIAVVSLCNIQKHCNLNGVICCMIYHMYSTYISWLFCDLFICYYLFTCLFICIFICSFICCCRWYKTERRQSSTVAEGPRLFVYLFTSLFICLFVVVGGRRRKEDRVV